MKERSGLSIFVAPVTLGALAIALAMIVAGCRVPLRSDGGDPQIVAFHDLEKESDSTWTVRWHPDVRTPALLEGRSQQLVGDGLQSDGMTPLTKTAEAAARAFFAGHAALFRLGSPSEELLVDSHQIDELGMSHVHLQQMSGGVVVWNHGLRAHFDRGGALVRIEGRYAPLEGNDPLVPTVTREEAARSATSAIAALRHLAEATTIAASTPVLVLDADAAPIPAFVTDSLDSPPTVSARLAFRLELLVEDAVAPARIEAFVDASTAEPYRLANILDELRGTANGIFDEPIDFAVAERRNHYYLEDAAAGQPAQKIYSADHGARLPGSEVSSISLVQWDRVLVGSGAALEAAAHLSSASDYFSRVHGRRGPSDDGAGLSATVHFGDRYANAFWNGDQLVFGDGDGTSILPLSGALDVVAHEYTHAVSEAAAHLGREGERGSLDEAVSDVFACFVEHAQRSSGANWLIGEDILLDPAARQVGLRDLADPHRTHHPAHVDEMSPYPSGPGFLVDQSDAIHANSTVAGHAAYLMTEGGTNTVSGIVVQSIGRAAAERIWYRALTRYLGPRSDFREAADATIAAARDLHGAASREVTSTTAAWQAVGVLPPP